MTDPWDDMESIEDEQDRELADAQRRAYYERHPEENREDE